MKKIQQIKANPDVVDIVGTYQDLQAYDKSTLTDKDIIRVLEDSTHNGASTYYRYNAATDTLVYIGELPTGGAVLSLDDYLVIDSTTQMPALNPVSDVVDAINDGKGFYGGSTITSMGGGMGESAFWTGRLDNDGDVLLTMLDFSSGDVAKMTLAFDGETGALDATKMAIARVHFPYHTTSGLETVYRMAPLIIRVNGQQYDYDGRDSVVIEL